MTEEALGQHHSRVSGGEKHLSTNPSCSAFAEATPYDRSHTPHLPFFGAVRDAVRRWEASRGATEAQSRDTRDTFSSKQGGPRSQASSSISMGEQIRRTPCGIAMC